MRAGRALLTMIALGLIRVANPASAGAHRMHFRRSSVQRQVG